MTEENGKILEELIYNLGYPVFNNQWVLYDETDGEKRVIYQIKNVELPNLFPKFETGSLPTGVQYYSSVEYDKEWTITLEEDTNLSAMRYFYSWSRSIYKDYRFQLAEGSYVKDFSLALLSPSFITADKISSLTTSRISDWGVNAANQLLSSAIGRLAAKASELLSEGITNSGAGITLVQRSADRAIDIVSSSLSSSISEGFSSLLTNLDIHTEETVLFLNMQGTILKGIEKLSLDYNEGDPIQLKVTLASDSIKATVPGELGGIKYTVDL